MGKAQRTKGAVGEREWVDHLKTHGIKAARDLSQTRDSGGDVPAAPFLFEVKRRNKIAVRKFLEQAETATNETVLLSDGRDARKYAGCVFPAVAMREDGNKQWMVLMSEDTFFRLVANTRHPGWNLPTTLQELL